MPQAAATCCAAAAAAAARTAGHSPRTAAGASSGKQHRGRVGRGGSQLCGGRDCCQAGAGGVGRGVVTLETQVEQRRCVCTGATGRDGRAVDARKDRYNLCACAWKRSKSQDVSNTGNLALKVCGHTVRQQRRRLRSRSTSHLGASRAFVVVRLLLSGRACWAGGRQGRQLPNCWQLACGGRWGKSVAWTYTLFMQTVVNCSYRVRGTYTLSVFMFSSLSDRKLPTRFAS